MGWMKNQKQTYTYDSAKNVLTELKQMWTDGTSTWENTSKETYTYNSANKVLTDIYEIWMGANWGNTTKDTNTYDSSGYLTYHLSQNWVMSSDLWENSAQSYYTNNTEGFPTQIVIQNWDSDLNNWNNAQRLSFNYTPLSIADYAITNDFRAYPNPVSENVTIKTNSPFSGLPYCITDQIGRAIQIGTLNTDETNIDMTPFTSGIYFIKIGQSERQTLKIVKK